MNVLQCDFVGYFCVSRCLVDVAIVKLEEEIPGNTPVVVQETEGRLITISYGHCDHVIAMAGQFLSEHVAVKQVEGKTFRPRRPSSVTILYCN